MKIGFIGLGIMGRPMAKNILKAGYDLMVYSRNKEAVQELVDAGATATTSNQDLASKCNVIFTMLPDSPQVKEVMLGENGVIHTVQEGTVYIDFSSIDPLASQEVAQELAKKGVTMLDSPVSGGEPKAIDGTLSFMVGGDKVVLEEHMELLTSMAGSVVHCGDIGAGNTTKLANQVIVALNIAGLSEALMLARRAGVDPNQVIEAIRGGSAASTSMNAKAPKILKGDFTPGFRIDLQIKDLNNAIQTGHHVGSPLPLTTTVMEMLQTLTANGFGSDDCSAVAKYYEHLTGETIANA